MEVMDAIYINARAAKTVMDYIRKKGLDFERMTGLSETLWVELLRQSSIPVSFSTFERLLKLGINRYFLTTGLGSIFRKDAAVSSTDLVLANICFYRSTFLS